ncbi:MAG: response regulator [Spirochaetes bacterium]|nr:response regulator [Spirochaetota bacterium]
MKYKKILIVDDSATSRMIIKRCFEIAGFYDSEYYEAEDGLKAVSFLRRNKVDLILSDLKMPKMDGNTFIQKLNVTETTKHIPVVVISSMGSDLTEEQLLKKGVKAIIRKPLSPEKVVNALRIHQ